MSKHKDKEQLRITQNKKRLLTALQETLGVVTTACEKAKIARKTYYNYYNDDPEFRKEVDSIGDMAVDIAESQLHKQIKEGNTTATIFFLKTKGKHRGYVEKAPEGSGTYLQVNNNSDGIDVKELSDEQLNAIAGLLDNKENEVMVVEDTTEVNKKYHSPKQLKENNG